MARLQLRSCPASTLIFAILSLHCCGIGEGHPGTVASVRWIPYADTHVDHLQPAGVEGSTTFFIARVNYLGGVIPGKLSASRKKAYFGFNGKEYDRKTHFEVLMYPEGALSWTEVAKGTPLPKNLLRGGTDPTTHQALYICRAWHRKLHEMVSAFEVFLPKSSRNKLVVGKLVNSTCYIPLWGREFKYDLFEALVQTSDDDVEQSRMEGELSILTQKEAECEEKGIGVVTLILFFIAIVLTALVSLFIGVRLQSYRSNGTHVVPVPVVHYDGKSLLKI